MNPLITDEMVEAATVASINASLAPYGEAITTTTDLQGGGEALAEMRAALEAVAPLIAAKVLNDAADEFSARLPDGTGNGRAYNSYSVAWLLRARADRIKRDES